MSVANRKAVAPNLRVVAIDDSKTVLATIRLAMEKRGWSVRTATDPSELSAEEVAAADFIEVDVHMEQVFGDDVVAFLREPWNVKAPIFLYSSVEQAELERRAAQAGATGAVCKTRGVEALIGEVLRVLEQA